VQIASYSLFVGVMAFFAQISDPTVGGTYMTLLNTVTNLGGNWPVTTVLSLTDDLTWRECVHNSTGVFVLPSPLHVADRCRSRASIRRTA